MNKRLTEAEAVFHFFRDTQDRQMKVPAVAAVYSTMKGYDIAIIQLGAPLIALQDAGIQPLELAADPPLDDEAVKVVGAPVMDVPRKDAFLRESVCNLGSPRPLIEFIWNFRQGLPNQCSDIKGGSYGSPVISQRTGTVVSMINTTTAGAVTVSGDFPCYLNQPCEVIAGRVHYQPDTNYALPVNELKACFNESGIFELNRTGCPLDPGKQLELSAPARAQQVPARWDVKLSGDAYTHYRYKSVSEASGGDCRDPNGYGAVTAVSEKPVINAELPRELGRYYLCVLGGNTSTVDESWQPARFASMVQTRIDDTKPTIPITYSLQDTADSYVLTPYFVLPELVSFHYKADTAGESTCQSAEGYRPYIRIPVRISKDSGTNRLCLYGEDEAGNRTNTLELSLRGTSIRADGVVNAASLQPVPLNGGTILTVLGVNLGASEVTAPSSGLVPGLGGLTAELTDAAGQRITLPLYYVGRDQVNALLSDRVSPGPATLTLLGPNGSTSAPLSVGERHPGLFTAGGTGFGAPAGTAIRTSGGATIEEPLFECGSPSSCFARSVQLPGPERNTDVRTTSYGPCRRSCRRHRSSHRRCTPSGAVSEHRTRRWSADDFRTDRT